MSILSEMKKRNPKAGYAALSDSSALCRVDTWVSTQCYPLDKILGGGIPVGRMVEIYGDTSTGKTLLAQHILAETQVMGGTAVMLDTETALDEGVAERVGIDIDNLIYRNPDTVEDVFEVICDVIEAKREVDPNGLLTMVWDSVAATSSEAEVEKVLKEGLSTGYPPTAREISQMMRVLKQIAAREHIALVLLNQTREKIGVMFGSNVSTFGGKAIGFYSSVRIELAYKSRLKDHGDIIGIEARAYIAKSKVSKPFGLCTMPIIFDYGIDNATACLDWLKTNKLITTAGGWHTFPVPDDDIRFQRPGWPEIFDEWHDYIVELMFGEDDNENYAQDSDGSAMA